MRVDTSGNLTVNTRVISRLHTIVDARVNTRVILRVYTSINFKACQRRDAKRMNKWGQVEKQNGVLA